MDKMKTNKILRAVIALLITAGILLLLDLGNRKKVTGTKAMKEIAIFKMSSRPTLDQAENGILESLTQQGFIDGKTCTIKRFSAEGDMPTANTIAQNIVSSKFDMVITISTPALQVMANANKNGTVLHVFCAVTDPYVSGVGITGTGGDQHPKHLVGIGTFQPVEKAFETARQMNPSLKKVGTVWCVSETCSEACVKLARKKCKEMGIELVEASVESTTQVLESAMSLTARGVDALWLGGDNVVEAGIDQLNKAAEKAQIPLFTNNPYKIVGSTLFGVGAEYADVGRTAGNLAAEVLKGKPTSKIRVENVVPIKLVVNPESVLGFKDRWNVGEFSK
jgi:putative ABC transport system substrate-binding protein